MNNIYKIKILIVLLCLFALTPAIVSCSSDDADIPVTGDTTGTEDAAGDNLPDVNYNGRVFRIMCDEGTLSEKDFIAESMNSEILNDAVFNRNAAVEARFGVKIEAFMNGYGEGFTKNLRTAIQAGDKICDVAMGMYNVYSGITAMIYEKNFVEWDELGYVDLQKPWWDKNVIRDINFADSVYCMTGDFNPSTLGMTRIILFNKTLFNDLGIEYPYQKVLDNKWTYDEFFKICVQGEYDLNGDGKIKYEEDRLGYVGWWCDQPESVFFGMGGNYIRKDGNGLPELYFNNEKNSVIIDKMIELFVPGNGGWINNAGWGEDIDVFKEGRSLMSNARFYLLDEYRDIQDDFGILPHPMYDETQEGYRQSVDGVCTMAYVPITNDDLEFTSVILEGMASESYRTVMPAYYDVVLTIKSVRDEESAEMVDLIKNSRSYPLQLETFNIVTIADFVLKKQNNLTSVYESKEAAAKSELDIIIDTYNK